MIQSSSAFVEQLYTQFLQRPSDPCKADWVAKIETGQLNAAEVTQQFLDSYEYAHMVAPVVLLYFTALGRVPDVAGLAFWVHAAQAGADLKSLSAAFVASEEFQTLYAHATDDAGFLDSLYQNALHRAAEPAGKAYWLQQMQQGLNRADVVQAFATSAEMGSSNGAAAKVVGEYIGVYQSLPSAAQLAAAAASVNPVGLITKLYADGAYHGVDVPYLSKGGVVVDGYIKNATVTMTTYETINGVKTAHLTSRVTDDQGRFDFGADAGFGSLRQSGGVDISTGASVNGSFSAPAGATVINPLTTLVQTIAAAGKLSASQAETLVKAKLGIAASVDLNHYDAVAEASKSGVSAAELATAVKVQVRAAQLNTLMGQAGAVLYGAGASASQDAGADAAANALASLITGDGNGVDLGAAGTVSKLLTAAAAGATTAQAAAVAHLAAAAGTVIGNLNQAIADVLSHVGAQDGRSSLIDIAKVQLAAENIETTMQNGAQAGDLGAAVGNTGSAQLAASIDDAGYHIGYVDADHTIDAKERPAPPAPPTPPTPPTPPAPPSDVTAPTLRTASVNGATLVLTYDEALDAGKPPSAAAFAVSNGATPVAVVAVAVDASAKTVTLTLAAPVAAGATVTLGYTDTTAGNDVNAIQDSHGNDAATLSAHAVSNNTPDTTAPQLLSATVDGATLVLTYDEALDAGKPPSAADFAVLNGLAPVAVTVLAVDASAKTVTLTLNAPAQAGDSLHVSYTDPTAGNDVNAIQDSHGNDAATLSAHAVQNNSLVPFGVSVDEQFPGLPMPVDLMSGAQLTGVHLSGPAVAVYLIQQDDQRAHPEHYSSVAALDTMALGGLLVAKVVVPDASLAVSIPTAGMVSGMYSVVAVDAAGHISAPAEIEVYMMDTRTYDGITPHLDAGSGRNTFVYSHIADFLGGDWAGHGFTGNARGFDQVQMNDAVVIGIGDDLRLASARNTDMIYAGGASDAPRSHVVRIADDAHLSSLRFIYLNGDANSASSASIDMSGVTQDLTLVGLQLGSSHLVGGSGNDGFTGGSGSDIFDGGAGSDSLGGSTSGAADTFVFRAGSSSSDSAHADTIHYGKVGDKIDLSALNNGAINLIRTAAASSLGGTGVTLTNGFDVFVAHVSGHDYLVYETSAHGTLAGDIGNYEVVMLFQYGGPVVAVQGWTEAHAIITVGTAPPP